MTRNLNMKAPQTSSSILTAIFEHQWELAQKYAKIEKMGDLLTAKRVKTNLGTKQGQAWIKDFAWRVTEELTESAEPIVTYRNTTKKFQAHYLEELSDALHFLTEMCIIADITSEQLTPIEEISVKSIYPVDFSFRKVICISHWEIVYYLGLFCNCLKQKKWRQSENRTDRAKALGYMQEAFKHLILCFKQAGCTDADIYSLYLKKHKINKLRQKNT